MTKIDLRALSACPACAATRRSLKFTLEDSKVYECASCSLRYLDPCLSAESMSNTYESDETLTQMHDFHEGYYRYGSLSERSGTRDEFERGLNLLDQCISKKQGRKILDVGFGNGFFLALAREKGWNVMGVDTSPQNVKIAKERFGMDLIHGLLESDIPSADRYDVISFWDVIEHFSNPGQVLAKARSLLKDNGCLLIGVPHDGSFLMWLSTTLYRLSGGKFNMGLQKVYFLEHVAYYKRKSLERLLHQNGFRLKTSYYSSTDLKKYALPLHENLIAQVILGLGKVFGMQNRMVTVFQKSGGR